jgi:hypothetical protein
MKRLAKTAVTAFGLICAALLWPGAAEGARQSFEIVTGSPAGSLFAAGEAIARVVSHPPGLPRCEKQDVCGPPGVMVSVRSSDGAVANVLAVDDGSAASGLAQDVIVAEAVAGRGPFRKAGRQNHVRVIAELFPVSMQLVAADRAHIRKPGDLRGKRVSLGPEGSGGEVIAGEVLASFGVKRVKLVRASYETSAELLQQGKLDAFFYLGAVPSPMIGEVLARGSARLVPIDGKGRSRLLARLPGLSAATINLGQGPAATVGCRVLWIAGDAAAPETVYGLVRALNHPANRPLLLAGPPAPDIRPGLPQPPLPLHQGAERYYRETGRLRSGR